MLGRDPGTVVTHSDLDGIAEVASWATRRVRSAAWEALVESERLPGGDHCLFRAIATAEFRSAIADSSSFELPHSPRRIHLALPDPDCPIGAASCPWGVIDCRGLGAVRADKIRWHSDLGGELGVGYDLVAH